MSASTFTPYLRAIMVGVSPGFTTCVLEVVVGGGEDRLEPAKLNGAAPLAADWRETEVWVERVVGDTAAG
jgi:hypothetical protein